MKFIHLIVTFNENTNVWVPIFTYHMEVTVYVDQLLYNVREVVGRSDMDGDGRHFGPPSVDLREGQ